MPFPVEISYRNVEATPAIEEEIQKRASGLGRFHDGILACRVVVESPHHHHKKGSHYQVRVDFSVRGAEIVANRHPDEHHAHEDIFVCIRDAFRASKRQLQEHARIQRGDVKTRSGPPHGHVARIFEQDGYGFIATPDGREVYFDARSVIGDFATLKTGQEVRFAEEEGLKGPQASSVTPVGRNSHDLGQLV